MPRYLPHRKFPAYSYVSGRFPHPHRDPLGHSFGVEPDDVSPPTVEQWQDCESYLWGIDLFNAGFYWEAHEAWEQVWISVGRQGAIADFLKALIKLAAAGVKAREDRVVGVTRHAKRALELFNGLENADHGDFFGLHVPTLISGVSFVADNAEAITHQAVADNQKHTLPTILKISNWPS